MELIKQIRRQVAIAGHVVDGQTGRAIKGACVKIETSPMVFENWLNIRKKQYGELWDKMEKRPDQFKTAPDGHFYFVDLPDGSYTLKASLPGTGSRYGTAQVGVTVARDGEGNIDVTPLSKILLPPTAIKGKIIKQGSADPVIMAEALVKGSGERALSNSLGEYSLTGIETGNRTVLISAQGFNKVSQMAQLSSGIVHTIDFTLIPTSA